MNENKEEVVIFPGILAELPREKRRPKRSFYRRKCPLCKKPLKTNGSGKWFCNNPKCPVYYVRYDRQGNIRKIVYAQGGF